MKPTKTYVSRPASDDPRDTESWALTEAARRLIDARRSPENKKALRDALILNQKLWTIFQSAIIEEDCPLPKDLRENLAALSILVDRETMARLVDQDAGKLDTLIEVNRNVASGLAVQAGPGTRGGPTGGEKAQQPSAKERISISI